MFSDSILNLELFRFTEMYEDNMDSSPIPLTQILVLITCYMTSTEICYHQKTNFSKDTIN